MGVILIGYFFLYFKKSFIFRLILNNSANITYKSKISSIFVVSNHGIIVHQRLYFLHCAFQYDLDSFQYRQIETLIYLNKKII